jgi:Spy/CpxP family protein refolding chaperone
MGSLGQRTLSVCAVIGGALWIASAGAQVPIKPIQIGGPAAKNIRVIAVPAVQPFSAVPTLSPHHLLRLEHVQQELELTGDQKQRLEEATQQYNDQSRAGWDVFRDLSPQERLDKMAEIRRKNAEQMDALNSRIEKILLPRQRRQLEEIVFRMRAQSALANPRFLDQLELDEGQKQMLQQLRKELDERSRQLQREMLEESLQVLTPKQRQQLDELGSP